jgi:hypothetical protein
LRFATFAITWLVIKNHSLQLKAFMVLILAQKGKDTSMRKSNKNDKAWQADSQKIE